MKTVLGIDPGINGGLAIISEDGVLFEKMPVIGNQVDKHNLFHWLQAHEPEIDFAMFELSHMRPGQSTQSVFTFGRGVGTIEMALVAAGISYVCVAPRVWTKVVHSGTPASMAPKDRSRLALTQLFPKVDLRFGKSQKPHEGCMDALLIAHYGRQLASANAESRAD
jgi:hypothetical protein